MDSGAYINTCTPELRHCSTIFCSTGRVAASISLDCTLPLHAQLHLVQIPLLLLHKLLLLQSFITVHT
jgi:hypothetical protein